MNVIAKILLIGWFPFWGVILCPAQNVLSELESIANYLPYAAMADSLKETGSLLKQPLSPNDQQLIINKYNRLKDRYQTSSLNYVKSNFNDTSALIILNYYFNIQKDSSFLRQALDIWEKKIYRTYYTRYIQEELNGLDSAVVGKFIPLIEVWDKNGQRQPLHTGKKTLLLFWASWCIPCRAENRDILTNLKKINDNGISVVSIDLDERQSDWLQASTHDGLRWTDWFAGEAWNSRIARFFTIHQIPQNVLIDKDGKILARNIKIERLY